MSSPLFAGVQALAQQPAGHRLGFADPAIYRRARDPRQAGAYSDIVAQPSAVGMVRADYFNGVNGSDGISYTVRTFGHDSSLATGPGWDPVTGVGSVNGQVLG